MGKRYKLTFELSDGSRHPVTIEVPHGKTAYQYALDGGYTGTEAEFAELMANGRGGGVDFQTDATLTLKDGILSVNTVNEIIQNAPMPVTSGAVYGEFSKAVALLNTI